MLNVVCMRKCRYAKKGRLNKGNNKVLSPMQNTLNDFMFAGIRGTRERTSKEWHNEKAEWEQYAIKKCFKAD